MDDGEIESNLAKLTDSNPAVAEAALSSLAANARPQLLRYLEKRYEPLPNIGHDDIVQQTFVKFWHAIPRYRNQGIAAWYKYLQVVADRCYLDHQGREAGRVELPANWSEKLAEEEISIFRTVLADIHKEDFTQRLCHAADVCWLGVDAQTSPALLTKQMLAAKWFYLDGVPWQEVIDLMGPVHPVLTRRLLDDWLGQESVLRALCYDELYFSNDRLAWHLLGQTEPVDASALSRLTAEAVKGSLSEEVSVLLWRYGHGMRPDEILERGLPPLTKDQLQAHCDRLAPFLPFKKQALSLCNGVKQPYRQNFRSLLCQAGVWKRLAFQYSYIEKLKQPDILERMQPAAQVAEYRLTPDMLNMWISGKRLSNHLAQRYMRLHGEQDDA